MQTLPHHIEPRRAAILGTLAEPFRSVAKTVIQTLADQGVLMVPYAGARDVHMQARLWRQSRTKTQIQTKIDMLHRLGASRLAGVLEEAGPQGGPWVTDALPGESAHQYGWALDCYLINDSSEADWNFEARGYTIFAETARDAGLISGIVFNDPTHIELRERPFDPLKPATIEAALVKHNLI